MFCRASCHWYWRLEPVAATVRVTLVPAACVVSAAGWAVIVGAIMSPPELLEEEELELLDELELLLDEELLDELEELELLELELEDELEEELLLEDDELELDDEELLLEDDELEELDEDDELLAEFVVTATELDLAEELLAAS